MNKIKKLFSSKYMKNITVLASGSIISQIISMAISPLTTRLFSPTELGMYTIVTTAISLFGPIICLKYDMVIVGAESEEEANSVITLSFIISFFLSIFLSIIYSLVFLSNDYKGLNLLVIIIIIFVLLLTYGTNNILIAYNNKNSLYKLISKVTILKAIVSNSMIVLAGIFNWGVFGLSLSQIIGNLSGIKKMSTSLWSNKEKIFNINKNILSNAFIKYINQPKYNAFSALVSTSIYSSINLFIKSMYSANILGLYSISYRVFGIPFSVISANIARVFYEGATEEKKDNGNYSKIFLKTLIFLSALIVPIMFFIAIISPWVFSLVFGDKWEVAGEYVRLLAPMFAVRLIAESLTTSFIISFKQNVELKFQIVVLFLELITYMVTAVLNLKIEMFFLLISFIYVIVYLIMIIYMYKISKLNI
ncbi:oligosaccharide flippase family protein [Carnobacterium sp.]|uniref:oligosaccharide flippase family protein n=1 Tax=Carnobacterium sp. TaxID=48221 RepID=UPI0028A965FF|nr:oligosaccharide flippase family protein [Carnobacterium sp.]